MEFTGERYLPEIDAAEISYEHWHRYCWAAQFVAGKRVLDIACGEGYGTSFLAEHASEVVGVDISSEVIAHASQAYFKANLHFYSGPADAIPIEGAALFDVVVSFETIEHLPADAHERFVAEVRRLLKPGGLFLVSTPNKHVYSDKPQYVNPFHLKEYYPREFIDFLGQSFRHVAIFGQRIYPVSYVWPVDGLNGAALSFSEHQMRYADGQFAPTAHDTKELLYLLAACSDADLPGSGGSVLIDTSERLVRRWVEVAQQKDQVAQVLSAEIAEQERARANLAGQLNERIAAVDQRDRMIGELMGDRDAAAEQRARLAAEIEAMRTSYERDLAELRAHAGALEQQAAGLSAERQHLGARLAYLEQELARIEHSRAWRLAQKWYALRRLAKSPRRLLAQRAHPTVAPAAPPAASQPASAEHHPATVLFISHDANRHGAQLLLLHFLSWLRANSDLRFEVLLKADGELRPDFEALAPVTLWNNGAELEALRERYACVELIYSNTITNGALLAALARPGTAVLCHVHELEYWIVHRTEPQNNQYVRQHTSRYIAVSQAVRAVLIEQLHVPEQQIDVVYEFIPTKLDLARQAQTAEHIRSKLRIPANALIVGASGTTDWRKGPDLFIQLARAVQHYDVGAPVHFVWVGGDNQGSAFSTLQYDIAHAGLSTCMHFVGALPNALDYFALFDVFALVSREDPFPLVNLEAAALEKPIVCFDNSGGAREFVAGDCGFVVPYLDIEAMARSTAELLQSADLRRRYGQRAAEKVRAQHDVDVVAPQLLAVIQRTLVPHSS